MAIASLSKDKSVKCVVYEHNGELKSYIKTNHANKLNSRRLAKSLKQIMTVEKQKNDIVIKLKEDEYARIHKNGEVEQVNELTAFETRYIAQNGNSTYVPFSRKEKQQTKLTTDLHTHFAAALSPEQLIECGIGRNINFPTWILDKVQIDYKSLTPNKDGEYLLEDIISNTENEQKLINSMKLDTSEQETFNKMEEIYAIRGPLTKDEGMFMPMVEKIAEDCKENGVDYIELSVASVISNVKQLKQLEEQMPRIEKETGVKVRFLGALWRHSDREWNEDEVDRLKVVAQSPYVVGCDFMGHETNPTMDFYDDIKELAKYAILKDPDFVIRTHAGENPLFKGNIRQVLLAIEEAHHELSQSSKKDLPYPQIRIGHGIYGFDEKPEEWESDRTKNYTTMELCKNLGVIVEFNVSSNLALNNINDLDKIPIKKYVDNGIQVVLGTDGKGLYSTDLEQEVILSRNAGLTNEDIKTIAQTENMVKAKADKRFKKHRKNTASKIETELKTCYRKNGIPQWNNEVEDTKNKDYERMQDELRQILSQIGAETDLQKVKEATEGKMPILITGSSKKHWPKVSDKSKREIQVVLDVLMHCIDTEKAYLVTGGTNLGVEREAHEIANAYNKNENGNLVVLGTFTEEAVHDKDSIQSNTVTHAIMASLNGKPAKRWFDLPDTVLDMVEEQKGIVIAIGGGSIVSDMIQRAHNTGLKLNLMSNVEGASHDKSQMLQGNGYEFATAKELVNKIIADSKELIRKDITNEQIEQMIKEAYLKHPLENVNAKEMEDVPETIEEIEEPERLEENIEINERKEL